MLVRTIFSKFASSKTFKEDTFPWMSFSTAFFIAITFHTVYSHMLVTASVAKFTMYDYVMRANSFFDSHY